MPIAIIVVFAVVVAPICAAILLSQNPHQNTEDREPQSSDFGFGWEGSHEYYQAHEAWERREAKRITYDLPLEEALTNDRAEELYWLEVSKRNPDCDRWNQRADYSSDEYHYCKVCGAIVRGGKMVNGLSNEGLIICNDCYASLAATRQSDNYELPDGFAEFSPDLWIYQATIEIDLDMGIIDEAQAERERKLTVAFVQRKLQREELARKQKAREQQAEQQHRDRISATVNRLHS